MVGKRRSPGGRQPAPRVPTKLPIALQEIKRQSKRWEAFTIGLLAQHRRGKWNTPSKQPNGSVDELASTQEAVRTMSQQLDEVRRMLESLKTQPGATDGRK